MLPPKRFISYIAKRRNIAVIKYPRSQVLPYLSKELWVGEVLASSLGD